MQQNNSNNNLIANIQSNTSYTLNDYQKGAPQINVHKLALTSVLRELLLKL